MDAYDLAIRIVIEEAELGLAPEGWPAWTNQIRYVPAEADAREAAQLFGELENDLNVAEFTAWLDGLQSERLRQVRQAIDVLRGALAEYRGDVDMGDGAGGMD